MTRKVIANRELKRRIIEISYNLGLSHIGSNLTAVDIIEEIYEQMKPDEKFVLSAGHAHLAHLVVKEKRSNQFPVYDIEGIIKEDGIHCDRKAGCDVSTGSLGHGIGIAVGMALADREKNVYCLLSDGELAEGSVTEALRLAPDNLTVYINDNGWSAYQESNVPSYIWEQTLCVQTNMDDYPDYLQGQLAHYKVLDKKEFKEVMEILQ